jgi:nucleoside-triphosphatase THEP1
MTDRPHGDRFPRVKSAARFAWDAIDPLVALALAVTFLTLDWLDVISNDALSKAFLALLTIVAFTLVRERAARQAVLHEIRQLPSKLHSAEPSIEVTADGLFSSVSTTTESELLDAADREVWLLQETGAMLFDRERLRLTRLLERSARIKIVVAAPTPGTAALMALRNRDLAPSDLIDRYRAALPQVHRLLADGDRSRARLVELRFTPYPIDVTAVMADPNHDSPERRMALIRLAGFQVTFQEKADFPLSGSESPRSFGLWSEQIHSYFAEASKIVLLTGPPRVGKTTVFAKALAAAKVSQPELDGHMWWALTDQLGEGEDRTGFTLRTSDVPEPRTFASKKGNGEYVVDMNVIDSLAAEITAAHKAGRVLFLDEIGPFQTSSASFVQAITDVMSDCAATLFATIAQDDDLHRLIEEVKYSPRSTLLNLMGDVDDRERIERTLEAELLASLRLTAYVPHEVWMGGE